MNGVWLNELKPAPDSLESFTNAAVLALFFWVNVLTFKMGITIAVYFTELFQGKNM